MAFIKMFKNDHRDFETITVPKGTYTPLAFLRRILGMEEPEVTEDSESHGTNSDPGEEI